LQTSKKGEQLSHRVCRRKDKQQQQKNWGNKVIHVVHASSEQIDASSHVLV
jgi:hypothetical protein